MTDLFAVRPGLSTALTATATGQPDAVIINGTDQDDFVQIAAFNNGTTINIEGLHPQVNITGAEGTQDSLAINTIGGNDVVDTSNLPANLIGLTVNLGDGQAAATTTLRTSTATAVFGQTVLLTATVNSLAGTPTGTVAFLNGNAVLGIAPINAAGQATLIVSPGVGNQALTAVFGGNGGFASSTSAAVAETVSRAATATTLSSSSRPRHRRPDGYLRRHHRGGRVSKQAHRLARSRSSTGTRSWGQPPSMPTAGRLSPPAFAAGGGHAIITIYGGDGNFVGSSQAVVEQVSAPPALGAHDDSSPRPPPGWSTRSRP